MNLRICVWIHCVFMLTRKLGFLCTDALVTSHPVTAGIGSSTPLTFVS